MKELVRPAYLARRMETEDHPSDSGSYPPAIRCQRQIMMTRGAVAIVTAKTSLTKPIRTKTIGKNVL